MDWRLIRPVLAIALLLVLAPGHASALEFRQKASAQGVALEMVGAFEVGDSDRLEALVARTPILEARLVSPGGVMIEGIKIGRILRRNAIATRVPSGQECASACFFAFLGGPIRAVDRAGKLGVHMHTAAMSDQYIAKLREILVSDRFSVNDRIRLIVLLNEQRSAQAAGLVADYVIRMGVSIDVFDPLFSTNSLDMHWLSVREMRRFNVVNIVE